MKEILKSTINMQIRICILALTMICATSCIGKIDTNKHIVFGRVNLYTPYGDLIKNAQNCEVRDRRIAPRNRVTLYNDGIFIANALESELPLSFIWCYGNHEYKNLNLIIDEINTAAKYTYIGEVNIYPAHMDKLDKLASGTASLLNDYSIMPKVGMYKKYKVKVDNSPMATVLDVQNILRSKSANNKINIINNFDTNLIRVNSE